MPEADVAGGPWDGDRTGVPMHITLRYPFVPAERLDEAAVEALAELLEPVEPWDYALAGACAFPDGTTYLAPVPAEPFAALVRAIARRWPEHPPYGGSHETIVPHVTIPPSDVDLDRLCGLVPLGARAGEAWLLERHPDRWWRRARFRFRRGRLLN